MAETGERRTTYVRREAGMVFGERRRGIPVDSSPNDLYAGGRTALASPLLSLRHPNKSGRVIVPIHRGKDLKPGTLASILDDAGLTPEEFRRLL